MKKITPINWENDISQYGPLSKETERQYSIHFRAIFKKIDTEIKNYIIEHERFPEDEIDSIFSDFQKVYKKNDRLKILYFDELLQNEIHKYEHVVKSAIYRDALAIELQSEKDESKYRIEVIAKEDNERLHQKKGDVFTQINLEAFTDYSDYWNYLIEVKAAFFLIGYVRNLEMTYGELSKRAIKEEIKEIEDFYERANEKTLKEAFDERTYDKKSELVRLTHGYYKMRYFQQKESILNKIEGYNTLFSHETSIVYAKYILYKDWLLEKLKSFNTENEEIQEKLHNLTLELGTVVDLTEVLQNSIDDVNKLSNDYNFKFDQVQVLSIFKKKHFAEVKRWIQRYEEQKEVNLSNFEDEYNEHYNKFDKSYWKTFKPNNLKKINDNHFLIVFGKNLGKAFLNDIKKSNNTTKTDKVEVIALSTSDKFQFRNNFDHVDEGKIYNHFHEGLVKTNLINESSLIRYLTSAFQKETIPEDKFVLKSGKTRKEITHIFYKYFTELANKPHGEKKKYVKLLTDYFSGYKYQSTFHNFSKGGY